jgi:hypothetical protein
MVKSSSPNAPSTWLIFLCPVRTLPHRTCLHSASSVLTVHISCCVIAAFVFRKPLFNKKTLPYLCLLHKYHVIYSVRYYPRFHELRQVLERITRGYGGTPVQCYNLQKGPQIFQQSISHLKILCVCLGDVKQVPYWGLTKIRWHHTKLVAWNLCTLELKMCWTSFTSSIPQSVHALQKDNTGTEACRPKPCYSSL